MSLAWGKEGGIILMRFMDAFPRLRTFRVEASGARVIPPAGSMDPRFQAWHSIACDGDRYLLTCDWTVGKKGLMGVQARLAPADWKGEKANEGLFLVAGDGEKTCMMGQAAAGPKGTFLVVYTEARGVEDFKVVARIVK